MGSLDYEFLRFIEVETETQKRLQSHYLPFFVGLETVVDLGCGDGDFLELLRDNGVHGIGVDYDQECCTAARRRGLDVVCQEAMAYLCDLSPESIDGIFSAHLVEHIPYQKVLELMRLSWQALRPGGVIVLTTPNVRGLYAHLEGFYMHFGHATFYHPHLLHFFLEQTGFVNVVEGENPHTARPMLGPWSKEIRRLAGEDRHGQHDESSHPQLEFRRELPSRRKGILGRAIVRVKMFLAKLVVLPYLDEIVNRTNVSIDGLHSRVDGGLGMESARVTAALLALANAFDRLDGAFEAYVKGVKPNSL